MSVDELGKGDELIIEMIQAERYEEAFGLSATATKNEMTAAFIRLSARHSGQESVLIALNKARNALLAETPEAKEFRLSMLSYLDKVMRDEAKLAEYERALTDDPEDSSSWYNKGLALGELGRHEEALEAFDRALAINPDDNTTWFQRGLSLDKLERHEEELAAYDQSLAIDSEDSIAWFNKGITLGQLGRHDEALDALDRSLAIDPNNRATWVQKALALDKLGRHEAELAAYDRALAIDPKDSKIWYIKGATLGQLGQYQEALHAYDRVLFLDAGLGEAWRSKGQALSQLGRFQEASEAYNRALAIDPKNDGAWYDSGIVLRNLGRYLEALDAFSRALAIDSRSSLAWQNKGLTLGQLGRHEEALEAFDRALAIDSESLTSWHNKGCALNQLGRPLEAIDAYDRVLAINAGFTNAWYNKGRTLNQLGRYEEALESFNRSLAIDPEDGAAWFQKGQTLEKLGHNKEALEIYDRALAIDPSSEPASNARKALDEACGRARVFKDVDLSAPKPTPGTVAGIGAKFYGRQNYDTGTNTYVTTHWLVVLYLPIVPLASYLVSETGRNSYNVYGRVPQSRFVKRYQFALLAVIGLLMLTLIVQSNSSNTEETRMEGVKPSQVVYDGKYSDFPCDKGQAVSPSDNRPCKPLSELTNVKQPSSVIEVEPPAEKAYAVRGYINAEPAGCPTGDGAEVHDAQGNLTGAIPDKGFVSADLRNQKPELYWVRGRDSDGKSIAGYVPKGCVTIGDPTGHINTELAECPTSDGAEVYDSQGIQIGGIPKEAVVSVNLQKQKAGFHWVRGLDFEGKTISGYIPQGCVAMGDSPGF